MHTSSFRPSLRSARGFTLIEMLIVIVIITILMTIGSVAYNRVINAARMTGTVTNLKSLTGGAHKFATDNGGKLPSPQYPGDYKGGAYPFKGVTPSQSRPKYWDLGGSGLWLDGTIFASLMIEEDDDSITDLSQWENDAEGATDGQHLVKTVFESTGSVETFRKEKDWYKHSFAMNANLQYDGLFSEVGGQADAWLTEKTIGNLPFQANAMLFIDCMEKNVVKQEDLAAIRDAAARYAGSKVVVGYLGGNVEPISPDDIPAGDVRGNLEASRFWRGVREE